MPLAEHVHEHWRILVVDDSDDDVELLRRALRGNTVHHARSAQDALAALSLGGAFDVCLLDYSLGGGADGLWVLEHLPASRRAQTPIIVLTASEDPAVEQRAMQLGAASFIQKGVADARLIRRVIRTALAAPFAQASDPLLHDHAGAAPLRILVVDDEPLMSRALVRALGRLHHTETRTRGEDALDLVNNDALFDAILVDVRMPSMTGLQLFAALAREHPALSARVGFMTSGGAAHDVEEALRATSRPTIEKPFTNAEARAFVYALAFARSH